VPVGSVDRGVGVVRTWVVGLFIGVCILTSSCKEGGTIPGHQPSTNSPGVKIQPKGEGLLKPFDFTYDCVTNQKLGKAEIQRCREDLELAQSDRKKGIG